MPRPDIETLKEMVDTSLSAQNDRTAEMKYVIVEFAGHACAIVFDYHINHSDMLCFMNIRNGYKGGSSLISAGFCMFLINPTGIDVNVWGESESLKKKMPDKWKDKCKSHPDKDKQIIISSFFSGPWKYIYPHLFERS